MKPGRQAQFGVTTRRTKTFGLPVGKEDYDRIAKRIMAAIEAL